MKDTFQNRLNKALSYNNMKPVDLVNKTKLSKALISGYINGKFLARQDKLTLLAETLNVDEAWLMGYDVPMKMKKVPESPSVFIGSTTHPIPVYGQISAGQPNWAEECIEGYFPIDPDLMGILNPEEHFFLRVNGESMNKVIKNGAFALIHKQDMVNDGEIAVVLVNGDCATLKKFTKKGDVVVLEPDSDDPEIKTQIYDKTTPIKILGKYIGKMEINK